MRAVRRAVHFECKPSESTAVPGRIGYGTQGGIVMCTASIRYVELYTGLVEDKRYHDDDPREAKGSQWRKLHSEAQ